MNDASVNFTEPVIGRKINREAVVVLGWGRAVLMQLAHPLVAAGVADYSRFRQGAGSYVRRARETVGAMLTITFGTPAEAQAAIDQINAIHDRVHGTLRDAVGPFPAGTPYTARDPRLLQWVHATLLESMVITYERLVGPLAMEEKDRYMEEAAFTTERLGVQRRDLPATYRQLQDFLDAQYSSGEIAVGPDAKALAEALLTPPMGPASVAFRISRLMTIGLLPPHLREAYGFEWDDRRERRFERLFGIVRRVRGTLPSRLREWPSARFH